MILKQPKFNAPKSHRDTIDFNDIKGQNQQKEYAKIAAAGKHNILMIAPSGQKNHCCVCPSILPDLHSNNAGDNNDS